MLGLWFRCGILWASRFQGPGSGEKLRFKAAGLESFWMRDPRLRI